MTIYNDAKGGAQILVVEDDPVQRRLLKNAVERAGHIPHMAENGRVGLEVLKRNSGQINVIVLDLMMPEMNGLEFLQRVQKEPAYQAIPVIIISTEGKEEDTIRGLKMGAKGYVKKPFQASELHGLIEKITTS